MKQCPYCGRELQEDAHFCLYCMKKLVVDSEVKVNRKWKSKKYYLLAFASGGIVLVLLVVGIFIWLANRDSSPVSGNALASGMTSGKATESLSEENANQSGVIVDGAAISWANMKIDNPDLNLTPEQLDVVKYFDNDYLSLGDYESLQRYPKAYRGAQISFWGEVVKVIETDDDSYQLLIEYLECETDEWSPKGQYIVVSGKADNERLIVGDRRHFYGRYQNVDAYSIDGVSYHLPTVTVNKLDKRLDIDEIGVVAKAIFGNDIKIKEPVCGVDFELDKLHTPEYFFYLVTPDNQSNANFSSFEFAREYGGITNHSSTIDVWRTFRVSADFNYYISTVFDRNSHMMYLEYYDRDFKKVWGREFNNVDSVPYDYTANYIWLVADNDLYIIDTKSGEDKYEPIFVGEKIKVNLQSDGAVLIGTGSKDNIMKMDLEGNIVWKASADIDVKSCNGIQIVDRNIITNLLTYEEETYTFMGEEYTSIPRSMSKVVVISPDGDILLDFVESTFGYEN